MAMGRARNEEKDKLERGGSSSMARAVACVSLAMLSSSYPVLVSLAKGPGGEFNLDVTTIPFVAEIVKLLVCILAVIFGESGLSALHAGAFGADRVRLLTFAVPAALYVVKNSIDTLSLKKIDPPTFQLLGNLKFVTTAVCLRLLLQKRLNDGKWAAVLLLCCSCSMQVAADCGSMQGAEELGSFDAGQLPGVVMVIVACLLSSLAGVYNEKLLKQHNTAGSSIYVNNVFLYGWGIVLNSGVRIAVRGVSGVSGILQGYNIFAWMAVANLALMGLTVSYVILHLDNLAKLFAGSMAMVSSTLLSGWLMHTDVTMFRCLTIVSVSLATYFYGANTGEMFCDDTITSAFQWVRCQSPTSQVKVVDMGASGRAIGQV